MVTDLFLDCIAALFKKSTVKLFRKPHSKRSLETLHGFSQCNLRFIDSNQGIYTAASNEQATNMNKLAAVTFAVANAVSRGCLEV